MARRTTSGSKPDSSVVRAALDAMSASELRELVCSMLPELDDRAHGRIVTRLIERAASNASGWTPTGPSADAVLEIISFAEAARRVGHADPSDIDGFLRQGADAFLGRDYAAALEIFRALLLPLSEVEIDLGQHEMVDEVLGVDVDRCAAQYVVSTYMTTARDQRALAVRAAIGEVEGVCCFWEPLRELERVAVEPLPEIDEFLSQWRALIEDRAKSKRQSYWDTDGDRWLCEVVGRLEGAEGLAAIARSTKRADDLRAWCRALVESRDWKAALPAYAEAAEIVGDKAYSRGEFLDGAALAAQELGRKNLPARLLRAWKEAPSMPRLRRWLGSSGSKRMMKKRGAQALDLCPRKAGRQRALLHLLLGDHESAAELLAAAPGLGWSDREHPGHLLFPLFHEYLGGARLDPPPNTGRFSVRGMDIDELDRVGADPGEPRLATPGIKEILELAGIGGPLDAGARRPMLEAMRRAAEKRVAGVTENKRRRYYGHAAQLIAACAALDSPETSRWVAGVRAEYRRYPALSRELNRYVGPA